jgi:hypothetical protein
MTDMDSTSGRIHREFVGLLFLQSHREIDRCSEVSGVQLPESNNGLFHHRSGAFSSQFKSKIGNILGEVPTLRITWNIDDTPLVSWSHKKICLFIMKRTKSWVNWTCAYPVVPHPSTGHRQYIYIYKYVCMYIYIHWVVCLLWINKSRV